MESATEALVVLRTGDTLECAKALAYSRDVAPQDKILWEAVLDYFQQRAPEEHWGYFGAWLSRGLAAGQPGEVAARRLLSRLEPCTRNQMLLANLDRLQNESHFRNLAAWVSTEGALWLELVLGWSEQPACSKSYACSHNLILALAQCACGRLTGLDQSRLSRACLDALLKHHEAPTQASLSCLPASLENSLGAESVPTLLALLELGADDLDVSLLKPFTKKKAANPTNLPAVRLCFHGLLGLLAHPEWDLLTLGRPLRTYRKVVSALIDLLYHHPDRKLQRSSEETTETYVRRLPPLEHLLQWCRL